VVVYINDIKITSYLRLKNCVIICIAAKFESKLSLKLRSESETCL